MSSYFPPGFFDSTRFDVPPPPVTVVRSYDEYNFLFREPGPSRCGLDYGVDIRPVDCLVAKRQLFSNEALNDDYSVATYYLNRGQDTIFDLPLSRTHAQSLGVRRIFNLVQQVYNTCPNGPVRGLGGFVAENVGWILANILATPIWGALLPVPAEFASPASDASPYRETYPPPGLITVSITKSSTPQKRPGETEAAIPFSLAEFLAARGTQRENSNASLRYALRYAIYMDERARQMQGEGGPDTWKDPSLPPVNLDTMTYQCDASLGSPARVDCEKMLYQGLGRAGAGTVNLGPGKTKIFLEGECAVGVSSLTPITIAWSQIVTAFNELVEKCIEGPWTAYGGRAFHAIQSTDSLLMGLAGIPLGLGKRDGANFTGSDALPAGVNVTIWKHTGIAVNATCEFMAAREYKTVKGCA